MFRVKKRTVVATLSLVSLFALAACSSTPVENPTDAPSSLPSECAAFAQYGTSVLDRKSVV